MIPLVPHLLISPTSLQMLAYFFFSRRSPLLSVECRANSPRKLTPFYIFINGSTSTISLFTPRRSNLIPVCFLQLFTVCIFSSLPSSSLSPRLTTLLRPSFNYPHFLFVCLFVFFLISLASLPPSKLYKYIYIYLVTYPRRAAGGGAPKFFIYDFYFFFLLT